MPAPSAPAPLFTFVQLWERYPDSDPCTTPSGGKAFENQCAIKVGYALAACGVKFESFRGPRCTLESVKNRGMVLRAEELAAWLRTRPFAGCPYPLPYTGQSFKLGLQGRTGIVFFKDYWLRAGEKVPTGDHIDLWNRDRLTPSLETFARFTLGIDRMPGLYSDLSRARQVLFWAIA